MPWMLVNLCWQPGVVNRSIPFFVWQECKMVNNEKRSDLIRAHLPPRCLLLLLLYLSFPCRFLYRRRTDPGSAPNNGSEGNIGTIQLECRTALCSWRVEIVISQTWLMAVIHNVVWVRRCKTEVGITPPSGYVEHCWWPQTNLPHCSCVCVCVCSFADWCVLDGKGPLQVCLSAAIVQLPSEFSSFRRKWRKLLFINISEQYQFKAEGDVLRCYKTHQITTAWSLLATKTWESKCKNVAFLTQQGIRNVSF